MTGPEHYVEAEAWLRKAEAAVDTPTTAALAGIGQVHATLALAAATAAADGAAIDEPWAVAIGWAEE